MSITITTNTYLQKHPLRQAYCLYNQALFAASSKPIANVEAICINYAASHQTTTYLATQKLVDLGFLFFFGHITCHEKIKKAHGEQFFFSSFPLLYLKLFALSSPSNLEFLHTAHSPPICFPCAFRCVKRKSKINNQLKSSHVTQDHIFFVLTSMAPVFTPLCDGNGGQPSNARGEARMDDASQTGRNTGHSQRPSASSRPCNRLLTDGASFSGHSSGLPPTELASAYCPFAGR